MTPTLSSLLQRLSSVVIAFVLLVLPAFAQPSGGRAPDDAPLSPEEPGRTIIRPQLGVQTMWFNGRYPVNDRLSPPEEDVPLGGGFTGPSNAVHLEVEVIPEGGAMIRIPFSFDAFFMNARTTFTYTDPFDLSRIRYTFHHSANIYSLGTGIRAAFFRSPNLYLSAEARLNYIPATTYGLRIYRPANDVTISDVTRTIDSNDYIRGGAYFKVGTQVSFFDPIMLDFSIGYGALNLIGKETDPDKIRNLLVIEQYTPQNRFRPSQEVTIGYLGVGFSIIWKL